MKILWITYAPIGLANQILFNKKSQSGGWIDATYESLIKISEVEIAIACIAKERRKEKVDERVTLYSTGNNIIKQSAIFPPKKEIDEWKNIIRDFNPEIIMIWGTEYSNGYLVTLAAEKIPVLFFIQGVVGRNSLYPINKIGLEQWIRKFDIISYLQLLLQSNDRKRQLKQAMIEKKMILNCAGIITDNKWSSSYYRGLHNNLVIYDLPLAVNKVFLTNKYDINKCDKHSIFTIAGRYPGKGLHQLILALKLVVDVFPDTKLYVPGMMTNRKPNLIFRSPYLKYIDRLIKNNDLCNNIVFCGMLSGEEMATHIKSCNVFVMPSIFENHSSSLREAMYVGAPCITSLVGSVDEFTIYGENAITYRCGEIDTLANAIIKVFSDLSFAKSIGECGYQTIREKYPQNDIGKRLFDIYKEVLRRQ